MFSTNHEYKLEAQWPLIYLHFAATSVKGLLFQLQQSNKLPSRFYVCSEKLLCFGKKF